MVNAVSFGKRDNENNPTGGKWIGAGVGAIAGGGLTYNSFGLIKKTDEFLSSKEVVDALNAGNIDKLKALVSNNFKMNKNYKKALLEIIEKDKKNPKALIEEFSMQAKGLKALNKFKTAGMVVWIGILGLVGLGLGAIVDHFRRKDEDD